MKAFIPNFLTSSNLFCGLLAVYFVLTGQVVFTAIMVVSALLMDFLDGFAARLLQVSSPEGKELDSLADMVSFGVVPGFVMARMMADAQGHAFPSVDFPGAEAFPYWLIGLLIPVFSALRLARFNLDTRQGDAFYGLPTPANTMLILSFWLIVSWQPEHWLSQGLSQIWVLVGLCLLSSYLLIANIRLLALKFTQFRWQGNALRYVLLGGSLLLIIGFQYVAIPFVILWYLLLSFIDNVTHARN